ncbi:proteinase-activated receptor 1-like [Montipora foliosa]|uniref:proteinase-activated receptor 1-like n=1 Tax=Montipora foliosa TaxID=591990 RepID=UPI0035F12CD8
MANDSHHQNRTVTPNFVPISSSECIAWLTVLNIEAVSIVTMNTLAIIIFLKERSLRKGSMYLVISLAVADMFVPYSLIVNLLDLGNDCSFWRFEIPKRFSSLAYFFPGASVTNLVAISLERMHATFRPFKHRLIEKRMFGAAVTGVWFTAALYTAITFSAPRLDITFSYSLKVPYGLTLIGCLFIILLSYSSIVIKLYCGTHPQHQCAISRERKLTKTLFTVTIVSVILLLPNGILDICFYVSSGEWLETISDQTTFHLTYSLRCLFYANSLINPLLYAYKMPQFKRALFSLFRCRSRSEPVQPFPLNDMKVVRFRSGN